MKRKAIHPLDSNSSSLKIASIHLNPTVVWFSSSPVQKTPKRGSRWQNFTSFPLKFDLLTFLFHLNRFSSSTYVHKLHEQVLLTDWKRKVELKIPFEQFFVFNSQIFQFANLFALEPIFSDLPVSCRVVEVFFDIFFKFI